MSNISPDDLAQALAAAATSHHDYETTSLGGERDTQWSGFYAAYALGRLGDFAAPSRLSALLEEAPDGDDWSRSVAAHVLAAVG